MKGFLFISTVFVAIMAFVNCDKYEDGRPDKAIINQFNAMYPDARDVDWDREGEYWVVSFETGPRADDIDHEMWFNAAGEWMMTETELKLAEVPQTIKDYLAADPTYGKAPFDDDDVKFIETPSGNFYRFDLKLNGRDVDVDVTEDGIVKAAKYGF